MPHLELRSLEKRYANNNEAVKGVSFAAEQGEFIVLVGPSGCGKSTTLRMIAGLEDATGGDIFIGGKRVNDEPSKMRDIAMVFQNYALYPHLTVAENIGFPLSIRKESKSVIESEVKKASELLSISHLLARKPKELSGGERQRVAVGRAIVRKPQVFLFDEPLSNLDAALRNEMRAELKSLQRRLGTTMIYVTHDQTEAMTMGDKIVVLNNGLVEQFGTPGEIYSKPNSIFVARFLGSPPMNLIRGKIKHTDGDSFFISPGFHMQIEPTAIADDSEILLGIRPEVLSVTGNNHIAEVTGNLSLTERLGSSTHYYMESAISTDGILTASEQGTYHSEINQIGKEITFYMTSSQVHLFDPKTGLRII
jgi:ABC-type sugar transport system ATPase subunit